MYDRSSERTQAVNRALLLCLFFVSLALASLMLVTVVGLFVEAVAETDGVTCGDAVPISSYDVTGTRGALDSVSRAVLAGLPQADDGVACGAEGGQRPVMRGGWSQDHLVLVVNYAPGNAAACERHVFVSTGEGAGQVLIGKWVTGQPGDRLLLTSFEETDHHTYSYSKELKACGDVIIYGLSRGPGSDMPGEHEQMVLSALADLLKEDARLKVRIVGHRASSGNAGNDYAQSVDDARTVKRMLVENYGTESKRVFAEGVGSEEPIADNETHTGRAANNRIEIVAERSCQRAKDPIIARHTEAQSSAKELVSLGQGVH